MAEEVEKLASKIEVLKEEHILPPQKAEAMEQAHRQAGATRREMIPAKPGKRSIIWSKHSPRQPPKPPRTKPGPPRKRLGRHRRHDLAAHSQMAAAELTKAMKLLADDVKMAAEENESVEGTLPKP